MKKLKTAVEFLEEIASKGFISPENFEQAKESERQQGYNEEEVMKKLKKIFDSFPQIETITFNDNFEIICKKKNGAKILCETLKELKKELKD